VAEGTGLLRALGLFLSYLPVSSGVPRFPDNGQRPQPRLAAIASLDLIGQIETTDKPYARLQLRGGTDATRSAMTLNASWLAGFDM
jgi:hypothetical protein